LSRRGAASASAGQQSCLSGPQSLGDFSPRGPACCRLSFRSLSSWWDKSPPSPSRWPSPQPAALARAAQTTGRPPTRQQQPAGWERAAEIERLTLQNSSAGGAAGSLSKQQGRIHPTARERGAFCCLGLGSGGSRGKGCALVCEGGEPCLLGDLLLRGSGVLHVLVQPIRAEVDVQPDGVVRRVGVHGGGGGAAAGPSRPACAVDTDQQALLASRPLRNAGASRRNPGTRGLVLS